MHILGVLRSMHNHKRLGLTALPCLPGEGPQGHHQPGEKYFRKDVGVSTWEAAGQSFPPSAPGGW